MTTEPSARELIQQAEELLGQESPREAAEKLAEASRLSPFDAEPPLLEAMIHLQDGRPCESAECALRAIEIRPFHPAALNLLAVLCGDAGYRTEARRLLGRVVREAPGFKQAARNLKQLRRRRPEAEAIEGFPIADVRRLLEAPGTELSVCLMVRDNDSPWIEALESVLPVADQLVLVDATPGRLDASQPVLQDVTVHRVAPTDDRAILHNEAIGRADRDWILLLNQDEQLAASSCGPLRQALEHGRALFHEVRIEIQEGRACLAPRLFRNAPGLGFAGCVLPSIRMTLKHQAQSWRLVSTRTEITLQRSAAPAAREYGHQDLAACARELNAAPSNAALVLQFARLATHMGDREQALQALDALERSSAIEPEEWVLLRTRCLMHLGRAGEAQQSMGTYHAAHPSSADTLYMHGAAAGSAGDAATAARVLARISSLPAQDSAALPIAERFTAALPNLLGASLMDLGRYDEAGAAFESALEIEPDNVEARMGLLSLNMARGEVETLLHELDDWIDRQGEDPRVWLYGSVLLGRIPDLSGVHEQWTSEACKRFPENKDLRRQEIEAKLRCGQIEAALELCEGSASQSPPDLAARLAASMAAGVEPPSIPSDLSDEIEAEVLLWLKVWLSHERFDPLDRALLSVPTLSGSLPGLPARTASWLDQIGQTDAASRLRQAMTPAGS